MHSDGVGRVRIDALERDVVGAGDHWNVATRIKSHAKAVRRMAASALPTASCVVSSEVLAVRTL
jgi:hypothetical protein